MYISLSQAFAQWQEMISPHDGMRDDSVAMSESWNDYTDMLAKDGQLCALQYSYAPAWDDPMPGEGSRWDALSDDREFILEQMGVTLDTKFVPFSQSRSKDEKQPSLNWSVTIKHNGREVITTDYMQGCGHAPSHKTPIKAGSHLQWEAVKFECETGKRVKHLTNIDRMVSGAAIPAPGLADVIRSLLLDASALDARDFADWCGDFGYDSDSIKARETYDACIAVGLKLRSAFGDRTMADLRDLFEGM